MVEDGQPRKKSARSGFGHIFVWVPLGPLLPPNGPRATQGHPTRAPHLPQKTSSASITAAHAGQAYAIAAPHFPQNRSVRCNAPPQDGQSRLSARPAAAFAAHSSHRTADNPRRRTGFHRAVRFPHSAHCRSRDAPASTMNKSRRSSGPGGCAGSPGGGSPIAARIALACPKTLPRRYPSRSRRSSPAALRPGRPAQGT